MINAEDIIVQNNPLLYTNWHLTTRFKSLIQEDDKLIWKKYLFQNIFIHMKTRSKGMFTQSHSPSQYACVRSAGRKSIIYWQCRLPLLFPVLARSQFTTRVQNNLLRWLLHNKDTSFPSIMCDTSKPAKCFRGDHQALNERLCASTTTLERT